MLLNDVVPTQWNTTATLERVAAIQSSQQSGNISDKACFEQDSIDSHVQNIISATCGNLYKPLVNKLTRYPIPELRLPYGSGEMFLDIGCNWGRWAIAAGLKGYNPVGIDPALEAIIAARKVSDQLGVPAHYVVADARYLPFAPDSFDIVFSYSVLQHFSKENVRLTLHEVARILISSGISLMQMPNMYGVRSLYHQIRRGFREAKGFEVRYWTLPELKNTFTKIIGETSLSVDGYFGLGIQKNDIDLLPYRYQLVVRASELLRMTSEKAKWMKYFADSIYLKSKK
jgi:2-polyprenyl-3-methyl-5-hydroxy-6-metoxy-1,4-benzoquinol methylase